jgi:hypothetical protein
MTTTRRVRRTAFAAALLAAAMTVPATAQDVSADGTPAVHTGNLSAYDRVADFYGAYIDAVYDSGHGRLAGGLRGHYLTAGLRARLAAWERAHDADGVLRAQGTPTAWKVTYDNSGAGHTFSRVTLTWGGTRAASYTYLSVWSDTASKLISDIAAVPNPKPVKK